MNTDQIENITHGPKLIALIIRADYHESGIHFFSPNDFSQQLAYMNRPKGYEIAPHVHNAVSRNIEWTQEVLLIKKGRVRVDFYAHDQMYLESRILAGGDVILLAHGGHGFTMLEESEIIEVKQGPYAGDMDKTRFQAVSDQDLKTGDNIAK